MACDLASHTSFGHKQILISATGVKEPSQELFSGLLVAIDGLPLVPLPLANLQANELHAIGKGRHGMLPDCLQQVVPVVHVAVWELHCRWADRNVNLRHHSPPSTCEYSSSRRYTLPSSVSTTGSSGIRPSRPN